MLSKTFDEGYRPEMSVIFLLSDTGICLVFILMLSKSFDEGYRPETSVIFLLCGTEILCLLLCYRRLLMKGIGPKRQSYFYSVILKSCVILMISKSLQKCWYVRY